MKFYLSRQEANFSIISSHIFIAHVSESICSHINLCALWLLQHRFHGYNAGSPGSNGAVTHEGSVSYCVQSYDSWQCGLLHDGVYCR